MNNFIEVPANKNSISMRKTIYSIAVNDAPYKAEITIDGKRYFCEYFIRWQHMLQRCYCAKYQAKRPTYKGCTVCPEWLTFSNFKAWMIKQDWEGKHLGKDILVIGNKVYSPDSCCFISGSVNSLLSDRAAARGDYPQGVTIERKSGKFMARISINGVSKYLGSFKTPKSASDVYRAAKKTYIIEIAQTQESRVKAGLLRHAEAL